MLGAICRAAIPNAHPAYPTDSKDLFSGASSTQRDSGITPDQGRVNACPRSDERGISTALTRAPYDSCLNVPGETVTVPHPIVLGLGVVFALYGLVFVQQILAIRTAKMRVRALIAGDHRLEQLVRDEPARFLAACDSVETRAAYEGLAQRYAGLQRHMLGFFGLATLLFLGLNIAGLTTERYDGLLFVDLMFALAVVLVARTHGKIGRFRSTVLGEAVPEPEGAPA